VTDHEGQLGEWVRVALCVLVQGDDDGVDGLWREVWLKIGAGDVYKFIVEVSELLKISRDGATEKVT